MLLEIESTGEVFLDLLKARVVLRVGVRRASFRPRFANRNLSTVRYPLFFIPEAHTPTKYIVALLQPEEHRPPLVLNWLRQLLVRSDFPADREHMHFDVLAEG